MDNVASKETKRPQKCITQQYQQCLKWLSQVIYVKSLKTHMSPKEGQKIQVLFLNISSAPLNEDSSTFNGIEYFASKQQPTQEGQKDDEKQKNIINVSQILSRDSLRERFELLETITSIEKMLMHSKYSTLCQYFKEIDEMLLYLRNTQKPPFLNTISEQLSLNSKIKVNQTLIQQILEIYPNAYSVSWSINEKLIRLDRSDLVIHCDLKSHLQINDRLQIFKKSMFEYIHKYGLQINIAPLPVNSLNSKTSDKNKNQEQLVRSIQEMPNKHVVSSSISKEPTLSKISQSLIEKLKQKKKLEIKNTDHSAPKKQLIALSTLLHQYFMIRDVSNMFLSNVIKYSIDSLKQFLLDDTEVRGFIEQLMTIYPGWIKLIDNQNGLILRMSKEVDLPSIIRAIESI